MFDKFSESKQNFIIRLTNFSIAYVLTIFITMTAISIYIAHVTGYLGGDMLGLVYHASLGILILNFIIYVICVSVFTFVSLKIFKIARNIAPVVNKNDVDNSLTHIIFFLIFLFGAIVVMFTTTGTIHREGYSNRYLDVIYAFIQPMLMGVIYIYVYFDSKSNVFRLNVIVYAVTVLYSGFVGYIILFLPLIFYFISKNKRKLKLIIVLTFLLLPFIPFIHAYKYLVKYQLSVMELVDFVNYEVFLAFSRSIIDRFSYIPNQIYISDNVSYFNDVFLKSFYEPWFQGYFGSLIYKITHGGEVANINGELAFLFDGKYSSNANFPLYSFFEVGSFEFSFLLLLYVLTIVSILAYMLVFLGKYNPFIKYLFFIVTFLYLFHGWFWPFMNFMQAVFIFGLLFIFLKTIFKGLPRT